MSIGQMYMRVIPSIMPKVGERRPVPTGPTESTEGTVTAVDPEGVIILKLVSGMMLVGYCARLKPGVDIRRVTEMGISADASEEIWVFNRVEVF